MSPTDKDKRNQKQITQERAEQKRISDLTSIEPLDRELLSELVTKLLNYISCDDTPEGVEARGALIQLNTHASILLTLKDRTGLSKLAHEFAAASPGPVADHALQQAKRKLDLLHDSMAYKGKKDRLTYGIEIASHMHPAFFVNVKV